MYVRDSVSFTSSMAWTGATPVSNPYLVSPDAKLQASGLTLTRRDAPVRRGTRIALREDPVSFTSGGARFVGKLILPATGTGPFPVVVYVHGSDNVPSVDRVWEPYLLAANGIGMLVFDKRGTGQSGGTYTPLCSTLANDVVAAVRRLRQHPAVDTARIGLAGFSQGGWVAPLAASKARGIRFVLVSYGMTMSIAEKTGSRRR